MRQLDDLKQRAERVKRLAGKKLLSGRFGDASGLTTENFQIDITLSGIFFVCAIDKNEKASKISTEVMDSLLKKDESCLVGSAVLFESLERLQINLQTL